MRQPCLRRKQLEKIFINEDMDSYPVKPTHSTGGLWLTRIYIKSSWPGQRCFAIYGYEKQHTTYSENYQMKTKHKNRSSLFNKERSKDVYVAISVLIYQRRKSRKYILYYHARRSIILVYVQCTYFFWVYRVCTFTLCNVNN